MGLIDKYLNSNFHGNNVSVAGVNECDKAISELEVLENDITMKIGRLFVEKNDVESVKNTEYEELLNKIIEINEKKEAQLVKKLALQGMRKCDKCGNVLVLDSAFCNKCGEKLEPLQINEHEQEINESGRFCPKCGTAVDDDSDFCVKCGNKL